MLLTIVLVVIGIYLLIGVGSWLWFAHDEIKQDKKMQVKYKIRVYKTTFPFIFMWGIILTKNGSK